MPSIYRPPVFPSNDDARQVYSRWTVQVPSSKLASHGLDDGYGHYERSPSPASSRTDKISRERRVLRKRPTFSAIPLTRNISAPILQINSKVYTPTADAKHPLVEPGPFLAPARTPIEPKFPALPRKASNVPLWLNRPVAKPSRASLRPEPELELPPPSPVQSHDTSHRIVSTQDSTSSSARGIEADVPPRPLSLSTTLGPSTPTLAIMDGVFSGIWKEDFQPSPFSRTSSASPSVATSHSRYSSRRSSSTPLTSISGAVPITIPEVSTSSESTLVDALPAGAPESLAVSLPRHQTAAAPWLKRPALTRGQQPDDNNRGQPICADYDYTLAVNVLLDKPSPLQPASQSHEHPRSDLQPSSTRSRRQSNDSFDSSTSWQCVSGVPDNARRAQMGRQRRKLKKRSATPGSTLQAKAKPTLFSSGLFSHSAASAR